MISLICFCLQGVHGIGHMPLNTSGAIPEGNVHLKFKLDINFFSNLVPLTGKILLLQFLTRNEH